MAVLNQMFCAILGVPADADREGIKKAYRQIVRRNHPDLFAPADRPFQELRMMQINEAFARLNADLDFAENKNQDERAKTRRGPTGPRPSGAGRELETGMAAHKDPAYAYYKQGFIKYSEGAGGMLFHGKRKLSPDERGLRTTMAALRCFFAAHGYFQRVVTDYPESIWALDAGYRLFRIERFMAIYRRIERNLQRVASVAPET